MNLPVPESEFDGWGGRRSGLEGWGWAYRNPGFSLAERLVWGRLLPAGRSLDGRGPRCGGGAPPCVPSLWPSGRQERAELALSEATVLKEAYGEGTPRVLGFLLVLFQRKAQTSGCAVRSPESTELGAVGPGCLTQASARPEHTPAAVSLPPCVPCPLSASLFGVLRRRLFQVCRGSVRCALYGEA